MSQIGRTIKHLEAPRPLKSRSNQQIKNFMVIEELIQLLENVAMTLASGISNPEPMAALVSNLRINGPQLESVSKDTLDRAFVTFRNASQDERLNIMTRLNLLELIELRAKCWQDDGINTYYKHKANNVEPMNGSNAMGGLTDQSTLMSTSPTSMATNTQPILSPGELIRTSGKFSKPTKIPGKNYSKDEVVIRNADSGKVNPGAKERLVQITGPNEEKINYAKHLIEDTIRRNASPVRLETSISGGVIQGGAAGGGNGSCSSLASSASDETVPRANNRNSAGAMMGGGGAGGLVGMTPIQPNYIGSNIGGMMMTGPGGKFMRAPNNNQLLLHSFSTNDASLGEYKYTVNVGQHLLKITGDCCELVRVAKLVLDDYFSSNEFLASVEAGAAFDGSSMLSVTTPTTPISSPFIPTAHQLVSSLPFADSGIGLNYMASHGIANSNIPEGDDDVFIVEDNLPPPSFSRSNSAFAISPSTQTNGLARSRRSHFSRKDSAPDGIGNAGSKTTDTASATGASKSDARIVHEYERLIYYSKSPHSWALPRDWNKILEKHPSLVRNKVKNDNLLSDNSNSTIANATTLNTANKTTATNYHQHPNDTMNIVRKGFFSRATNSIDETQNESECSGLLYNNDCNNKSNDKNTTNTKPKLTMDLRSYSTTD